MKKRHSTDQIVEKLRWTDVELGKGARVPDVCRHLGVSEQTYDRWHQKHGDMAPAVAKQLRAMKSHNIGSSLR